MPTYYLLKHLPDHTYSVYTSDNRTTPRKPTIREAVASSLRPLPLNHYGRPYPTVTRKELKNSPTVEILYTSKSPIVYFFIRKNHPEIFL